MRDTVYYGFIKSDGKQERKINNCINTMFQHFTSTFRTKKYISEFIIPLKKVQFEFWCHHISAQGHQIIQINMYHRGRKFL